MPRRLQQKKRETLPNKLFSKNNASADDKIIKQVTSLTLDFLKKKEKDPYKPYFYVSSNRFLLSAAYISLLI